MKKKRTKQIVRIVLLVGTAISLFFVPWPILKVLVSPLQDSVQEQVNKAVDMGFDGIIVYVDEAGQPPAYYAAGYKNREEKVPADPHALFKIASVGKLYNALAIAKLARSGRISLDSSLAYYMPELKGRIAYADEITVRLMVEHRSGIPNFTDTHNYWMDPKKSGEENLALVLDQPADFKPGKAYAYCNTNYLLLGMIMDRVLGYNHFEYIREAILDQLQLTHTFGSIHEVDMDEVMSGYYVGYDADLKTDDVGSMLATAEDLGKFIRALNDGQAFTDREEQEIYSSIYKLGHTGLIPGYQTIARYHEEIDAVVVQFTNTVNFNGYNWNLSSIEYHRIVRILKRNK